MGVKSTAYEISSDSHSAMNSSMFDLLGLCFGLLLRLFHCRESLLIENLALRQQLAVFKRKHSRPRLAAIDKLFWVALRGFWSSWKKPLIVVTPDTVVRWHYAGFQYYWRLLSRARKQLGTRPVSKEIREAIFKIVAENPTWRAPRIHGEVVMLGFEISERKRRAMDAACSTESPLGTAMDDVLAQSPRSDRRHGLFLSADHHLRSALLLLCPGT